MKVLALDPSATSCGFAFWDTEIERVEFGAWHLANSMSYLGDAGRNVHHRLSSFIGDQKIDHIFCEQVVEYNKRIAQISRIRLYEVYLHVHSFGREMGIPVHDIHAATWRRTFLGITSRGTTRKQFKDMSTRRCRYLGFLCTKDDMADAIGVLTQGCLAQKVQPYWLRDEVLRGAFDFDQVEREIPPAQTRKGKAA